MKTGKQRSRERLNHISIAIKKIEEYTQELNEEEFYHDTRTNEAVLFQLSVIGEAIWHVDNELLEKYQYPWHGVRALRNVITHEYFGIALDKIWSVIQHDMPVLKEKINAIIQNEF